MNKDDHMLDAFRYFVGIDYGDPHGSYSRLRPPNPIPDHLRKFFEQVKIDETVKNLLEKEDWDE